MSVVPLLAYILFVLAVNGQALTGNATCESIGAINHFDWEQLMSDVSLKPNMTYSMSIDQSTLSLAIDVELEYVGFTYADAHSAEFGTTFVLDFEDFNAEADNIREPGNCQNRVAAQMTGSWESLWTYSDTPAQPNHIANESTLAYPASDVWDLTIDADCTPIKYHAEFDWATLRDCGNFDASQEYIAVTTDANWINLTGVFYVNVVSPLTHYTDTGFYRVYQMLSAPFVIAVRNQVNIISSVGINLFTLTIIAIYKEDLEENFRLIVLTESADFLMLSAPDLLSSPTLNPNTINFEILTESINSGCLTASSNLCSQLWEINANNVTCPPTNFTGSYALEFTTICNPDAVATYANAATLCDNYITTYGAEVGLTAGVAWVDAICDPQVFTIQFDGQFGFYNDSSFEYELGVADQYRLGDTAFVEVQIHIPVNAYDVFGVTLDNVWVCTTSPDNEPLTVSDQTLGTGGCLGANIDAGFPWHIVVNGAENDLTPGGDITMFTPFQNASLRFSFLVDPSISRTNIYVQAQVSIDLVTSGGGRRRARALLQSDVDTASQKRHFDGSTGINPEPAEDNPEESDNDKPATPQDQDEQELMVWIIIGVMVGIINIFCIAVCLFVHCFKKKGNSKTLDIVKMMKSIQADNNKVVTSQKDTVKTPLSPNKQTAANVYAEANAENQTKQISMQAL